MPRTTDRPLVRRPAGPEPDLLTVKQLAEMANLSVGGVNYSIVRGILPAWQFGAVFLVPRREAEEWIARHGQSKSAQAVREEEQMRRITEGVRQRLTEEGFAAPAKATGRPAVATTPRRRGSRRAVPAEAAP